MQELLWFGQCWGNFLPGSQSLFSLSYNNNVYTLHLKTIKKKKVLFPDRSKDFAK
jgi:hypothetical protein